MDAIDTTTSIRSLFPLIVTDRLRDTADFYERLLGMEPIADVGWYVQLGLPDHAWMQIAIIEQSHDSVPSSHQRPPAGVVITIEVDDVDVVHATAAAMGIAVHVPLRSEDWGQRHFITEDPSGLLVDIVTPIPPTPDFLAAHSFGSSPEAQ